MATQPAHEPRPGALEDLAQQLGEHASEFTPAKQSAAPSGSGLPGRHPGQSLSEHAKSAGAAASVVIDCGTSRRSGYSHVLWIAPSAPAVLGSDGLERLSDAVARMPGVSACEWEGSDRLHLRAAGSDWDDLLQGARAAVDEILA
ncbi:hypothetical protein [Demequina aurantiaca]|uniref:hypothetical protein n=1 Tax=Demequina aurantiaca TaxID=676200 RepID=UPI003D33DF75